MFCGVHLLSAVFSIACILSSMVDLIKNLWTNVGLADGKREGTQREEHGEDTVLITSRNMNSLEQTKPL